MTAESVPRIPDLNPALQVLGTPEQAGLRDIHVEPVDPASLTPAVGPLTRQYLAEIRHGDRGVPDGKLALDALLATAAHRLDEHLAEGYGGGLTAYDMHLAHGGKAAYTSARPPLTPLPGEAMYDFALRVRTHQEATVNIGGHPLTLQRTCDGRYESEIYPLDYWSVIKGYAATGDWNRVQDGVDFFAHRILKYGYPFNGNRIHHNPDEEPSDVANYYARRSQPPTFAYMVRLMGEHFGEDVYAHEPYIKAMELLWKHFNPESKLLAAQPRGKFHAIRRGGISPERLPFSVFGDDTNNGRPYSEYIGRLESFLEDEKTATEAAERAAPQDRERVFGETLVHLAGAAEWGWDMSASRQAGGKDLSYINTTNIVPVELQCEMADMAEILSYMHAVSRRRADVRGDHVAATKHYEKELYFTDQRAKRLQFINTYMRDPKTRTYHDLELVGASASYDSLRTYRGFRRTPVISAAMLHTLYSGAVEDPRDALHVAEVARDQLLGPGGFAVTNMQSGEQWDGSNSWASPNRAGVCGPIHASAKFAPQDPGVARELLELGTDGRASSLYGIKVMYDATGTIIETVNAWAPDQPAVHGEYPKDTKNPNTPRNFAMQVGAVIEFTNLNPTDKRDRLIPMGGRFAVANSRAS